MLVEQPLDRGGPEPAARARPLVEQQLARERLQLAAEPARERNAEAGLAARRATGGGRSAANARRSATLPCAAVLLQRVGQREAELDDAVVEQRRAQLERVRHRRDVRLRQQVARQVRREVEQLEAGDPARRRRPEQEAGRRERADLRLRLVRPELGALLEREDLHEPPVALGARHGRRLEEARGAEERRAPLAPRRRAARAAAARPARAAGAGTRSASAIAA